jgi:hypothetical protein
MQVKIKNTLDAIGKMLRDGIPAPIVDDIVGKEVTLEPASGFVYSHSLNNQNGTWNIAPECYEIVKL